MTASWWKTYREILLVKAKQHGVKVTLKPNWSCPNLDPDIWVRDMQGTVSVFRQSVQKAVG